MDRLLPALPHEGVPSTAGATEPLGLVLAVRGQVGPLRRVLEAMRPDGEAVRQVPPRAGEGPSSHGRAVLGGRLRAADEGVVRHVSLAPQHASSVRGRGLRGAGDVLLDNGPVPSASGRTTERRTTSGAGR